MLRDDPWMLTISDRSGHILHTNGHPRILEWAGELNAVPGGSMAEEHIGTGAANAVLASGGAEYVLWSEHYCQVLHDWACLGVPVRYPSTRELMGVLVAGGDELTPLLTVKILGRLAARLEQLLAHEELVRRVALLDTHQRFLLDHPQDAVLALDGRGQTPTADDRHYGFQTRCDRPVAIACLNPRHDDIIDDTRCNGVRHNRFESISHFETELPVRRHNEKDQSIVDTFPSNLPFRKGPHGPIVDGCVAGCLGNVDNQLVTG